MEKKAKKDTISFKQILMGNVLLNAQVIKWMPVAIFLAFMGILMISSRFRGEKVIRKMAEMQDSVRELRSESSMIESELMMLTKYSTIQRQVEKRGLGLKISGQPPVKIEVSD
ncbi:MAG TPA: FtsL-like putative cell division protein [Prolixibacteraceae bacterium]|jgi:predicted membrane protein|nr:FtsL-like putative cell division protein [Prolixibacteraceae bacterium]HQN92751.1 FtsL-like putative cell division protein [Prolixibacteraceae bacterium]